MPTGILGDLFNRHSNRVNQIVDTSYYRYKESDDFLLTYFPIEDLRNWKYISQFVKSQVPIASVIGLDSEIPSMPARVDLTEAVQNFAKIAISHPWGERELRQYLEAFDSRSSAELQDFMLYVLFGPVATLADSVIARAKMLTWQLISSLQLNYTDPLTRTRLNIDFSELAGAGLFPAALTGADSWDAPTTATGLADLRDHLRIYREQTGSYPDEIVMSDKIVYALIDQDATRSELMGLRGLLPDDAQLSNVPLYEQNVLQLNSLLARMTLEGTPPKIRVFNKVYPQLNPDDTITDIPYLNPNTYVFLKRMPATPGQNTGQQAMRMGAMIFGPTVESAVAGRVATGDIRLIQGRMTPGPYAWARLVKDSPYWEEACCVANFVPVPGDPRFFAARKVIV